MVLKLRVNIQTRLILSKQKCEVEETAPWRNLIKSIDIILNAIDPI